MAIVRLDQVAGAPVHITTIASAVLPGGAPNVGDFILGYLYNNDNGGPRMGTVDTGWTPIHAVGADGGDPVSDVVLAYRLAKAGDTATYTMTVSIVNGITDGSLLLARYSGLGTAPGVDVKNDSVEQPATTTSVIPTITPGAGKERLIIATVSLSPNYDPAIPGTWTRVLDDIAVGNRQTMQLYEKIVASTAGSYGGETMGPVGLPAETSWWDTIAALGGGLAGQAMIGGSPGGGML